VWLEDYRLACHAGGETYDLFVMKNLPHYLGDSARMWLEHLPRDKIQDWTVVWTCLGLLPRWVPGLTTRWALGTTRLVPHGT
jgi:hypothetical protein